MIPHHFQDFIDKKIKLRKQDLIEKQNLQITVHPDFAKIFKASESISSQRGMSYFLIRLPKKSIYQQKYEKIYEEKKQLKEQAKDQNYKLQFLNDKICDFEEIEKKHDKYSGKLHKLFELGIINKDGEPITRSKT